ncbi:MAG: hypothetical protein AB7I98_03855 [Verrucomicrobiales bacterium]
MKSTHSILTVLFVVLVAALLATRGIASAWLFAFVGGALLITPAMVTGELYTVTVTPTLLVQRMMKKLVARAPALAFFASDFTPERLKLGQTAIGKIRLRPTVSEFDAENGGYLAGKKNGRELLLDVPFVMDKHIHVTIEVPHLHALQDSIQKVEEHTNDGAEAMGDFVSGYLLDKVRSASFSNGSTFTTGNSDQDALTKIREEMNLRGVPGSGRFGLVNTLVASALGGDARITNRYDSRSQNGGDDGYRRFFGVEGFKEIAEVPLLPSGNTTPVAVTGVDATDLLTSGAAHGFRVGDRVNFPTLTGGSGLTADTGYYYVESVPSTTTFKISATRGGGVLSLGSNVTDGTVRRADNISGFFGTREAILIKTGIPTDALELAQELGIPVSATWETLKDPTTGLTMLLYKWFKTETMTAYVTAAVVFGAVAGEDSDTAKHVMEPSGHILRTL